MEKKKTKSKPNLQLVKPYPMIPETDIKHLMLAQHKFQQAYGVPLNDTTRKLYRRLIEEEHEEWVEDFYSHEAFDFDELKELADLLYVTCGLYYQIQYIISDTKKHILKQDETWDHAISTLVEDISTGKDDKVLLLKLMYCLFAYSDAMGWDLNKAYERVHSSNMSKLGDDGKPVRREDGKILKGPNYKPPFLEDLTDGK